MDSKIDFLEINAYTFDKFCFVLDRYGLRAKLEKAQYIGIKPNLCAGSIFTSESGVVINKALLISTCAYIRKLNRNCRLAILESDSTGHGYAYLKFEKQGYKDLTKQYDVELVDLTSSRQKLVYLKKPKYFNRGIWLSQDLLDIDFFISVAKIKTHNVTTVSCSLKNLFGCLSDSNKSIYHPYLSKVIADINYLKKPDLCICEGSPALEGNGPVMGTPKDIGVMVLSNDPVACDAFIAKMVGFNPSKIEHIQMADKCGIGTTEMVDVDIDGYSGQTYEFEFIGKQQLLLLRLGLMIQLCGHNITYFGHLLHQQKSLFQIFKGILKKLSKGKNKN